MRIFIANLPFTTTKDELQRHFEQVGTVSTATIIFDRETDLPRGLGFIDMPNDADAKRAIGELNGSKLGDPPRVLRVEPAKERQRQDRPESYGRRGG